MSVRRTAKTVVVSWPAVRDPGGLRDYRIKVGARTFSVAKPAVTLSRATLRTAVSVDAGRPGRQRRADDDRPLRRLR